MYKIFSLLFIVGIVIYLFTSGTANHQTTLDEKSFENINTISINTVSGNIEINSTKESTVHVELVGKTTEKRQPQLITEVNNNQLIVVVKKESENNWFNLSMDALLLKVYVPEKLMDHLQVKSDSGDILIDNLEANQMKLSTMSGDIQIKRTIGAYILYTSSGNIDIDVKEIDYPIKMNAVSGDIHIRTKHKPKDATITAKTVSGQVAMFDTNHNSMIFGQGKNPIEMKTSSGNISIDTY